jgi:hypothetical protein
MLSLVIGLILLVAIAVMAYRRTGSRPLYVAALLIALLGAFACNALIPSRSEITQATTDAERAGAQFLFDYGPPITVVWLAVAVGCLLAVIVYRRPDPRDDRDT